MRKARIIFIAVLTFIFIWPLIGAILTLPPAIPVVIVAYILILFFTGRKEEVKARINAVGDKTRDAVEVGGAFMEDAGRTAVVLTANVVKAVSGTAKEGYKQIGEEEGVKKALEALGKLSEVGLKLTVEAGIVAGKVVVEVSKYTMKRIQQEQRKRLESSDRRFLEEFVEFVVLDDD